jgi:probable F420-dependent oxidoreductase
MTDRIAISITLSALGHLHGPKLEGLLDAAKAADSAGVDQLVITDHLAIGERTDRYPYGDFPFPVEEPWPEALTTLAAIAGATHRIRLGTGILIAPLRAPLLLAKTLATLDVLSQGRLDCGVGAGWQPEEFEAAGVPFEERWSRLDDALRACRALWTQAPASFSSPSVSFENLWCMPQPVQTGGVPLWFGMRLLPRNVARITEHGAGWMPIGSDLAEIAAGIALLRDAFERAGRDPSTLGVRANVSPVLSGRGRIDLDATLASLPGLRAAGITVAAFPVARYVRRREEIPEFLDRIGSAQR